MDRKYQIFISSTYEDLKEQRDAVVKAVLKMGHLPVGMEMFNAAEQQQWEIIKRHIDNSDYYVLIVASRYGSIGPKNISYTEQEYEYALEKGVPCLGFLLQKGTAWPDTMVETGPAKKKLDAFKKKIGNRPVNFWDNTDKLALQVYASLSEAITLTARPGWIRATEVASPQVADELARLSKENDDLKSQLEKYSAVDETKELQLLLENTFFPFVIKGETVNINLVRIFKSNLYESEESDMYDALTDGDENYANYKVFKSALLELRALGLLSESNSNPNLTEWVMTEKGNKLYTRIRQENG